MSHKAWSIGRADADRCDILLHGETISGVHATLNQHEGNFYLSDSGSTNGTCIKRDDQIIDVRDHTVLLPGDTVCFGRSEYSLDDLVAFSYAADGCDVRVLTVLHGRSPCADRPVAVDAPSAPQAPGRPHELPAQTAPKIRCFECTSVISRTRACPECGSTHHLEEKL